MTSNDDTLSFDLDLIEHDPVARGDIVKSISVDKLMRKLATLDLADHSFKHFEVTGDKVLLSNSLDLSAHCGQCQQMAIGQQSKDALLAYWQSRNPGATSPRALTLYHLLWLVKMSGPADVVAQLHLVNPSGKWTAEKYVDVVEIRTLKYLHQNNALVRVVGEMEEYY